MQCLRVDLLNFLLTDMRPLPKWDNSTLFTQGEWAWIFAFLLWRKLLIRRIPLTRAIWRKFMCRVRAVGRDSPTQHPWQVLLHQCGTWIAWIGYAQGSEPAAQFSCAPALRKQLAVATTAYIGSYGRLTRVSLIRHQSWESASTQWMSSARLWNQVSKIFIIYLF